MSLLSTAEIFNHMYEVNLDKRLVITPLLSQEQISDGTVDLRVGTDFIIPKRSDAHLFDPMEYAKMREISIKADIDYVPIGEAFYLHPNKVMLAGTIEYLSIPNDLAGRVQARSSYERLGLSISTLANPGYRGALTLTLVNTGNTPIVLYPGVRVAQMSLYQLENSPESYEGKYLFEVGPVFSRAHEDKDLEKIRYIAARKK
jgi:dCTP deaminase